MFICWKPSLSNQHCLIHKPGILRENTIATNLWLFWTARYISEPLSPEQNKPGPGSKKGPARSLPLFFFEHSLIFSFLTPFCLYRATTFPNDIAYIQTRLGTILAHHYWYRVYSKHSFKNAWTEMELQFQISLLQPSRYFVIQRRATCVFLF